MWRDPIKAADFGVQLELSHRIFHADNTRPKLSTSSLARHRPDLKQHRLEVLAPLDTRLRRPNPVRPLVQIVHSLIFVTFVFDVCYSSKSDFNWHSITVSFIVRLDTFDLAIRFDWERPMVVIQLSFDINATNWYRELRKKKRANNYWTRFLQTASALSPFLLLFCLGPTGNPNKRQQTPKNIDHSLNKPKKKKTHFANFTNKLVARQRRE